MSKEKIIELAKQADRYLSKIDDLLTVSERKAILRVINGYQRIADENAALREALRLKELECEALSQRNFNLALRNKQLEEKLADVWDSLYGQGFEVAGYHLNGDLEPMDNFFDSNDWNF